MNRIDQLKKIGEDICNKALAENRNLTKSEAEECQRVIKALKDARDDEKLVDQIDRMSAFSQEGSGSIADTFRQKAADAGIPVPVQFPAKAIIDAPDDAAPMRLGGIREMGFDQRYAYSVLPRRDLGNATSIQELVQSSRDLASVSEMIISLTGGEEKPTSVVGAELATFTPVMIASVSEALPNALLALPAFNRLVDRTLRQAFNQALDHHVISTLESEAGTTADAGDDLLEQLRKARTAIEAEGFNPRVALVSPEDSETLDLMRADGATGSFLLPPAPRRDGAGNPLWNLQVAVAKGITDPIVIDPAGVTLYMGAVTLAADPYSNFKSNETLYRFEGPALTVVHNPEAIYVVAPGG